MKLQNLTVIFIIIIIPIILITSYYMSLQMNTIKLQTSYDTKLQEATREAMSAFEINTVEWNSTFSNLADSKRRDVQASINTFLTSMANKMGIAGTAKEYMKQYVPAIAYTLYDGYYIQSMTDIDNGILVGVEYNEESSSLDAKEYKNESNYGMQAFTPYSETLTNTSGDFITINYTLDNYVRVYGNIPGCPKEGYLVAETLTVGEETLQEQICYTDNGTSYINGVFEYVYDTNNTKWYWDKDKTEPEYFRLDADNKRIYASRFSKKPMQNENGELKEIAKTQLSDYSAKNYYKESMEFTTWFNNTIVGSSGIEWTSNKLKDPFGNALKIKFDEIEYTNNNPDPANEAYLASSFTQHKREVMRRSIEESLERATNAAEAYLENSSYNYRLPELAEEEWDQVLSDVSILAFLQGVPIGLKYYNNYAIASSTNNKEYVNPNQIYFSAYGDEYYHRKGCAEANMSDYVGYRSTDYIVKSQKVSDTDTRYYYLHDIPPDPSSELACYHCIVDNNEGLTETTLDSAYKLALARERYVQQSH